MNISRYILSKSLSLCLLLSGALLASCSQDKDMGDAMSEAQLINEVTLSSGNELKIAVGMTQQVTATINPTDVQYPTLVWTSYNTDIATVDQNGNITGVGAGQASIHIRQEGNTGDLTTLTVNVKPKATSISLDDRSMYEGTTAPAEAILTPADAYDNLDWTIADNSIAEMKDDSIVAKQPGTTTITAKTTDGSNLTATAKLTVKKVVPVTGIDLATPGYDLNIGDEAAITCNLIPSDATADLLTWTSSNEKVATVNNQGHVTAIGYGTANITATASNGISKTVAITVGQGTINQDFTTGAGKWYINASHGSYTYDSNGLVVTMKTGSKWRGDWCLGSNSNPVQLNVGTYRYLAFKMTRPGKYIANNNGQGTIVLDTSKGRYEQKSCNGNNRYSILGYEGKESEAPMDQPEVIYFDLQQGFGNTPYYFSKTGVDDSKLTTFKLLIADIPSTYPGTYTIYWVHAFKTLDELKAFANK
jgi:uncharacterized protein YjdB